VTALVALWLAVTGSQRLATTVFSDPPQQPPLALFNTFLRLRDR